MYMVFARHFYHRHVTKIESHRPDAARYRAASWCLPNGSKLSHVVHIRCTHKEAWAGGGPRPGTDFLSIDAPVTSDADEYLS